MSRRRVEDAGLAIATGLRRPAEPHQVGVRAADTAFFAARAVDEVFATLVPRVLGGAGAPTLVDGPGFDAHTIPDGRLLELERVGDELFLHYAFDWS